MCEGRKCHATFHFPLRAHRPRYILPVPPSPPYSLSARKSRLSISSPATADRVAGVSGGEKSSSDFGKKNGICGQVGFSILDDCGWAIAFGPSGRSVGRSLLVGKSIFISNAEITAKALMDFSNSFFSAVNGQRLDRASSQVVLWTSTAFEHRLYVHPLLETFSSG